MSTSDKSGACWRDRMAHRLCNLILNRLATPWYRNWISGSIRYGLRAAARDEGVTLPGDELPGAQAGMASQMPGDGGSSNG